MIAEVSKSKRVTTISLGGNGGTPTETITFADNEYINSITVRSGSKIDAFGFTTNRGRSWGPFGGPGGSPTTLKDIFVIGIGGRSGSLIDKLDIRYIENYKP